jgi:uncharacterized protein
MQPKSPNVVCWEIAPTRWWTVPMGRWPAPKIRAEVAANVRLPRHARGRSGASRRSKDRCEGAPVRITLPDGSIVDSGRPDVDRVLSNVVQRQVKLKCAFPGLRATTAEEYWPDIEGLDHRDTVTDFGLPENTFFDSAVVHLLTTATVDRLRALYPEGRFEVRRFRPNIVVETAKGEKDFVENAWIGRTLAIGEGVLLSVTGPCPRCVMTTLPQADLPKDPGILRTAAQHNRANVGIYASVVQGGMVRRGDSVRLE